jgi:hypothetical protein
LIKFHTHFDDIAVFTALRFRMLGRSVELVGGNVAAKVLLAHVRRVGRRRVVRLERGHHGLAQTILAFRLKTILCEVELFSILYVYPYKKLPPPYTLAISQQLPPILWRLLHARQGC